VFIAGQGITGNYWSSIVANDGSNNSGNKLGFTNSQVNASSADAFSFGFGVRCVREPATLEVDPTMLTFINGGGSQSVTVTTNQPNYTVTVTTNSPWVTVPTGPQTGGSFTVTTNSINGSFRIATITVTAGDLTRTIRVMQSIAPTGVHAPPGVLGVGATSGNLTLVGSRAYAGTSLETNSEFGPVATEDVYVSYFKWGGVVGTWSRENHDLFDAMDVAWVHPDYTNAYGTGIDAMKALIGTQPWPSDAAWALIPSASASAAGQQIPANTPANLAAGTGDPCAFASKGTATGTYVTPAYANGGWGGFGLNTTNSPWQSVAANPELRNPGLWALNDPSMFLPAAGYRFYDTGTVMTQGMYGYYWSSTASSSSGGRSLWFLNHAVYTAESNPFVYGFPIRCVRSVTVQFFQK
jgi:hypothetical protein